MGQRPALLIRLTRPETAPGADFTVEIARIAGPNGGSEIVLGNTGDGTASTAVRVGPQRFTAVGKALADVNAQRIVTALVNERAEADWANGQAVGTVSLIGLSAALRYVYTVQHRVDTFTAAAAKGRAADVMAPAALLIPVVHAPALNGTPARLTKAQIATMKRAVRRTAQPDVDCSPVASTVGGCTSLAVLPCSVGACNVIGALFVISGNRVQAALTDAPRGSRGSAPPRNQSADRRNGSVENENFTSYAKGRPRQLLRVAMLRLGRVDKGQPEQS